MLERLKEIINTPFSKGNFEVIEINGEKDHVYILFEIVPQLQLSKFINNFKTVSSRYIQKEFQQHLSAFYWKPYFWNRSYLVLSTGGTTVDIIKKYIQEQKEPDD